MADYSGENRLLRAEDVAEQLQISLTHAYRLMEQGVIRSVRFGRVVRVRAGDLNAFIEEHISSTGGRSAINQVGPVQTA